MTYILNLRVQMFFDFVQNIFIILSDELVWLLFSLEEDLFSGELYQKINPYAFLLVVLKELIVVPLSLESNVG